MVMLFGSSIRAPCSEYAYHFIIAIDQKAQESPSLAKKEEGDIKVERGEQGRLVDATRQVTPTAVYLGTSPTCLS